MISHHQVCVLNCELLVNHQASDSGVIEDKEMGVETQVVVCQPTTIGVPNLDAFVTCSQIVCFCFFSYDSMLF